MIISRSNHAKTRFRFRRTCAESWILGFLSSLGPQMSSRGLRITYKTYFRSKNTIFASIWPQNDKIKLKSRKNTDFGVVSGILQKKWVKMVFLGYLGSQMSSRGLRFTSKTYFWSKNTIFASIWPQNDKITLKSRKNTDFGSFLGLWKKTIFWV